MRGKKGERVRVRALAIVQKQIQKPKIQGNANWKRRIVQGGGGMVQVRNRFDGRIGPECKIIGLPRPKIFLMDQK